MSSNAFYELAEEDRRRLRNMSAPPRMTIELHPLSIGKPQGRGGGGGQIMGVIDSTALLVRLGAQAILKKMQNNPKRKALLLAGLAVGEAPEALLSIHSGDEMFDRFTEMAGSINIAPYGLPSFAVAVSAPEAGGANAGPMVEDPKLAVVLLSRISGPLFLRSRAPHLPPRNFLTGLAIFYDTTGGNHHG